MREEEGPTNPLRLVSQPDLDVSEEFKVTTCSLALEAMPSP
jgi:hypothetical protein